MTRKLMLPGSKADDSAPRGLGPASLVRRRLLHGGLSAAPVLMVSAPRSVMASDGACATGSAYAMSTLAQSGVRASQPVCSGHSPEYWSGCSLSYWPGTCLHTATSTKKFDDLFGSANGYGSSVRLRDVVSLSSATDKDKLARYVVAALLNVRKGKTPAVVMTESTVMEIWAACSAGSYYEPTAGVFWYAGSSVPATSGGVVEWLKSTMT